MIMDEKIIYQSKNKGSKVKLIITICLLVVAVATCLIGYPQYIEAEEYTTLCWRVLELDEDFSVYKYAGDPSTWTKETHDTHALAYARALAAERNLLVILEIAFLCAVISVLGAYKWFYSGRTSITITDRRIYGTATFGKEVDLPLSSVVMIRKSGKKNMTISTSGGNVRFVGIKNRNEVYSAIQTLLAIR